MEHQQGYQEIAKGLRLGNLLLEASPKTSMPASGYRIVRALVSVNVTHPCDLPSTISNPKSAVHYLYKENKILHISPGTDQNPNLLPDLEKICKFINTHIITDDDAHGNGHIKTLPVQTYHGSFMPTIIYPYVVIHGTGYGWGPFVAIAYLMWKYCQPFQRAFDHVNTAFYPGTSSTTGEGANTIALTHNQREQLLVWEALGNTGDYNIFQGGVAEPGSPGQWGGEWYKKVYHDFLNKKKEGEKALEKVGEKAEEEAGQKEGEEEGDNVREEDGKEEEEKGEENEGENEGEEH